MPTLRILSRADVAQALPMALAIPVVRRAFAELSTGRANIPLRVPIFSSRHNGTTLFMPGYLSGADALAIKVVSVFPRNLEQGLPLIHALVLVIDSATGRPLAAIEGGSLTALRTGAGSGVATDLLSRADSRTVAIIGSGEQARTQLEAVCAVRAIQKAWIYSRHSEHVQELIAALQARLPQVELLSAASPSEAVVQADIICTATTSYNPVFDGSDLQSGTHINAVGSFLPQMQEVDSVTLQRSSKIVVDSRAGAMAEAGDLLVAIERGVIRESDIYGEIGEIAAGLKPGRENAHEITYFKSVGNAVQDVASALAIYEAAGELGLGTEVEL